MMGFKSVCLTEAFGSTGLKGSYFLPTMKSRLLGSVALTVKYLVLSFFLLLGLELGLSGNLDGSTALFSLTRFFYLLVVSVKLRIEVL